MLDNRIGLYRQIESLRGRPLIAYVTSARVGAPGQIAGDCVPELMDQLNALPLGTNELDLFLVSNGGDPTAAWRIVSLIRERVKKFAVLVPQAAYSAATLIALGADEIVMHPNGNLGPTDPQIKAPRRLAKDQSEAVNFGSEDLSAFLKFARDEVGLTDQSQMLSVFNHFCEDVGSVAVGVSARSAQLSVSMGEKLLQQHMDGEANRAKARSIAQALTTNYFHHGYAVSRREARDAIELPVAAPNEALEKLMWDIWLDLSADLKQREPFQPMTLLRDAPQCAALFSAVPMFQMPGNLPPAAQQQALNAALAQTQVIHVPPLPFKLLHAVMESPRLASSCESSGLIFATRLPDSSFKVNATIDRFGWFTALPASPARSNGPVKPGPSKTPISPKARAKSASRSGKRSPKKQSQVHSRKRRVTS